MREARRALNDEDRYAASDAACTLVARSPVFMAARSLAVYHAVRGELDVEPLQHLAWRSGKKVCMPVISEGRRPRMGFAEVLPTTPLALNRFGIAEPASTNFRLIDPRSLDLVLTPLVAFDGYGHRVGMGAGYYDRCFRFLSRRRNWRKPKLLGIAYAFQEVDHLEPQPWDIPLWGIATEKALRRAPDK